MSHMGFKRGLFLVQGSSKVFNDLSAETETLSSWSWLRRTGRNFAR